MSWPDRQTWAFMNAPENCGMCQDAMLETNPFSDLVTAFDHSFVRLARNQAHPGYCLVILNEHATELHNLDSGTLAGFWSDVTRVARAMDAVFHPIKIDYLVMGHRMPHVHCHLYPQYLSDNPFHNPDISEGEEELSPMETADRVGQLRRAMNAVDPAA